MTSYFWHQCLVGNKNVLHLLLTVPYYIRRLSMQHEMFDLLFNLVVKNLSNCSVGCLI